MLRAEKVLREELARTSLATLQASVLGKGMPASFVGQVQSWFADRQKAREDARIAGMRARVRARAPGRWG